MSVKSISSSDKGNNNSVEDNEPAQTTSPAQLLPDSPAAHQLSPATDEETDSTANHIQQSELVVHSEESSIKSTSEEEDDIPQPFQGIDLE